MKNILIPIFFLALIFGIYSFIRKSQTTPFPKSVEPTEKIIVGNVEGYPNLGIIAQEKGYFAENGLQVSFKEYATAPSIIQDLHSGNIDMISASAEFLVARDSFAGDDIKILAVVSKQENYWELIARRDRNIHTIEDLKGKRIGISYGTVGQFLFARFMTFHGLKETDVRILDAGLSQRMSQIAKGELDAVVLLSPYTEQLKHTLGENAISWPIQLDWDISSVSYATEGFIRGHQRIAERYLRALIKAEQYIASHEQQARVIMQNKLKFSDDDMKYIWPHFTFKVRLEQTLLLTMEDEARWVIENKLTNKTKIPNYLNFIYFDALEKIAPERVTMIH